MRAVAINAGGKTATTAAADEAQPRCSRKYNAKYTETNVMIVVWLLGNPGSAADRRADANGRCQSAGGSMCLSESFRALVTTLAAMTPNVQRGATSRRTTCTTVIAKMTRIVMRFETPTMRGGFAAA